MFMLPEGQLIMEKKKNEKKNVYVQIYIKGIVF